MSGFSIGDEVRLTQATPRHEWTARLVGEKGRVVEVKDNALAVEGLTAGSLLWFVSKQLEVAEEGESS